MLRTVIRNGLQELAFTAQMGWSCPGSGEAGRHAKVYQRWIKEPATEQEVVDALWNTLDKTRWDKPAISLIEAGKGREGFFAVSDYPFVPPMSYDESHITRTTADIPDGTQCTFRWALNDPDNGTDVLVYDWNGTLRASTREVIAYAGGTAYIANASGPLSPSAPS